MEAPASEALRSIQVLPSNIPVLLIGCVTAVQNTSTNSHTTVQTRYYTGPREWGAGKRIDSAPPRLSLSWFSLTLRPALPSMPDVTPERVDKQEVCVETYGGC